MQKGHGKGVGWDLSPVSAALGPGLSLLGLEWGGGERDDSLCCVLFNELALLQG